MAAQIPDYSQERAYRAAVLRAVSHLDPGFVDAATGAVRASDHLQKALDTTAAACIADSGDASRWSQVEDELEALLKGVRNTNLTRKHRIAVRALQA